MIIENKYELRQEVYLKTDVDQKKRIVTAITVRPMGYIVYELSCGETLTNHIEIEISVEKDVVLSSTN